MKIALKVAWMKKEKSIEYCIQVIWLSSFSNNWPPNYLMTPVSLNEIIATTMKTAAKRTV